MIFISSDWHLNHSRIIEYDNRPFNTVEDMNDSIIDNCNDIVKPDDVLYYLGDFAFALGGKLDSVYEFRRRILCENIHFILGNHDKFIKKNARMLIDDKVFLTITDVFEVRNIHPSIWLSHYSHKTWPGMEYGKYHCFGHSHCNLEDDTNSLSMDVGINGHSYFPWSFDEIKTVMTGKKFVPVDHHKKETV